MSDLTKCEGKKCPIKDKCYRYTSKSGEYQQSWFTKEPFKIKKGVFKCDMFWGENTQRVYDDIVDIVNGNFK